jgi:hypothetical protein
MIAPIFAIVLAAAPMKPCKDIVALKKNWETNQWYVQRTVDGPWFRVDEGFVVGLKCFVENVQYETA